MQADTDQSVAKDDQAASVRGDTPREVPITRGLSAQLLVLTIAFVMLAEVLIYVPSVARERLVYLEDRIAAADQPDVSIHHPVDSGRPGDDPRGEDVVGAQELESSHSGEQFLGACGY